MRKSLLTVLSFAAISTAVAQMQYPTDGLRALYELDNNFMNAISTNYQLQATVGGQMNATFANDRTNTANKALDRSVSSSFGNSTVTDNLSDFTMGAWVKLTSYTDGINLFSTVMTDLLYAYDENGTAIGGSGFYTIRIDGSGYVQAILVGGGASPVYSVLTSSSTIPLNEWHQITWTVDQTLDESRLYIDGVQVALVEGLITTVNNPSDFKLGNVTRVDIVGGNPQYSQWQVFTGIEDEVFIYERILNECEIKKIADLTPTFTYAVSNNDLTATDVNNATYQWYNCATNQPISGETNPTFSPTDEEDYYVVVSGTCIADTSDCMHITINTNGIEELEQTTTLFPNPSNESVQILGVEPETVLVFDAAGRLIIQQKSAIIPTSTIENGIYSIIIENKEGKVISKRLVVQH